MKIWIDFSFHKQGKRVPASDFKAGRVDFDGKKEDYQSDVQAVYKHAGVYVHIGIKDDPDDYKKFFKKHRAGDYFNPGLHQLALEGKIEQVLLKYPKPTYIDSGSLLCCLSFLTGGYKYRMNHYRLLPEDIKTTAKAIDDILKQYDPRLNFMGKLACFLKKNSSKIESLGYSLNSTTNQLTFAHNGF